MASVVPINSDEESKEWPAKPRSKYSPENEDVAGLIAKPSRPTSCPRDKSSCIGCCKWMRPRTQPEKIRCGACFVVTFFTLLWLGVIIVSSTAADMVTDPGDGNDEIAGNEPYLFESGTTCKNYEDFDFSPYFSNDVEEIEVASRDGTKLKAFVWLNRTGAPTVVIQHGFGVSRRKYTILMPAVMLRQMGFNVIAADLRNHGESPKSDTGRITWGYVESDDMLGAWDYAVEHLSGGDTDKVGLQGASMGGCITATAFGRERRAKGAICDSPVCGLRPLLRDVFTGMGLSVKLQQLSMTMGFVIDRTGVDIPERQPNVVLPGGGPGRKMAFLSGTTDATVLWET